MLSLAVMWQPRGDMRNWLFVTVAAVASFVAASAHAQAPDIETYCKDVTRGEGRILQCLSSHQDKISGRCSYALDDASIQLERVALAIKYVAAECKDDLMKHCGDIPVGDGRVAQCLKKNNATLAANCKQALKDTQMEIK